jgi:hypothetical protein
MKNSLPRIGFICLFFIISTNTQLNAQWLDWVDVTQTNLTLSSVAFSDDEEKDMEAADFNNDGFDDIIVVRKEPFSSPTEPAKSDLLLMNIGGELIDQTSIYAPGFISTPTFARDLFIGDFDNDGWQDVIIANTFGQAPIYYRNLGNENGNWLGFADESSSRFPSALDDVALICAVKGGDLDGDGSMDLYFVNYRQNQDGGTAKDFLFMNDGNGNFIEQAQARLGDLRNSAFGTEAELKDMDNDGDLDIVKVSALYPVAPWNVMGVFILFNNGDGTFTNWQNISGEERQSTYMIEIEDFNLDGKLDVFAVDDVLDYVLTAGTIVPNISISYSVQVLQLTDDAAFLLGGNVHAGDFDLDGDMDIAVADVDVDIPPCNSDRAFTFLRNDDGVFSYPYEASVQEWSENVYDFVVLDLNNDGLLDVVTGKCSGYSIFQSNNCELAPSSADFDQDGIDDACDDCPTNPDPNCTPDPSFPIVSTDFSLPRQWNELLLESIRRDLARPTVHARNLFHVSAAMWDVWAAFKDEGCTYLFGQTVDGFSCDAPEFNPNDASDAAIETAISYASYRILSHRFSNSVNGQVLQNAYDNHMNELSLDIGFTSTDYSSGDPAALGNAIAECYVNFGLQDNSNEQNDYNNLGYQPVNPPLVVDNPGNPDIVDVNRWQPLTLDIFIDQSGNVIAGATPGFLSPEWGNVTPFSLSDGDAENYNRAGQNYKVFHDPGTPPLIQSGGGLSDAYKWNFATTAVWSSHLDPNDGVMWDISPGGVGNPANLPTSVASYPGFYDQINGGVSSNGYNINPVTGLSYQSNIVPRGDYARVIAEYWADGPSSETPPGHWFTILNEVVSDHPAFEKRMEGQGAILGDLEWYAKSYFMLGGAMHDAAVTSWGIKGWYDYVRPVSAIRAMADKGQSSNTSLSSYDPQGIPLINDQIEVIGIGDALAGPGNVNVGKIKLKAWAGHDAINNVDVDQAGVDWILASEWVPYQRPSFVTPNFAGYVSGHSTFSQTAATVLTSLTGTAYFPGGMGSFLASKDNFLVFENGPSIDVELQWATYQDAANESALSRIWGGIHPPADDTPGRIMGLKIGADAFSKAISFFEDADENGAADMCQVCEIGAICDDGDDSTFNDVVDGDCGCVGTPCPTLGTSCDDGDTSTFNDVADGNCGCAGTACPTVGTSCDDGDTSTFNDVADGNCGCAGTEYCSLQGNNGTEEYIGRFQLGTIDNSSLGGTIGYSDFSNISTDLSPGFTYTAEVTTVWNGQVYNEGYSVWIDYNQDGDFDDAGEQVWTQSITQDSPVSGSFTIPPGASLGNTRLRVAMSYNVIATSCGDFFYGEVEDYSVNLLPENCPTVGTTCDDGDASTFNDIADGDCGCAGTACPTVGTSCDDGDASTFNDIADGDCGCAGTACPTVGTTCDDGNASTFNDIADGDCGCAGTACPTVGTTCDDGDASTSNDMADGDCGCAGTACPTVGLTCDDGDDCTTGEVYDANCNCTGGTFQDSDSDGVCDSDDLCPGGDDSNITTIYLTDLSWNGTPINGWGPTEIDQSNGEKLAGDGSIMSINGQTFARGLGVHAESEVVYSLNSEYMLFESFVGVDDEVSNNGSVQFLVYTDGVLAYQSPTLFTDDEPLFVSIDVSGVNELRLVVNSAVNGLNSDHADWADAKLSTTCAACSIGASCDDGNALTSNDMFDDNCDCVGVEYCSLQGNNGAEEYIGRFQLGTIDNSSLGGAIGYSDFNNISTDLTAGSDYTVEVTTVWVGQVYNEGYSVWIDYNQDGDFDDAGEQVWTQSVTQNSPVSGSFTVPPGASLGNTRLRVAMSYNVIANSCGDFFYGEVEDYNVVITGNSLISDESVDNKLGIETNNYSMSIYPNPTTAFITLELNNREANSYRIMDINGKVVMSGGINNSTSKKLDINQFQMGYYYVTVMFENGKTLTKRFIKVK